MDSECVSFAVDLHTVSEQLKSGYYSCCRLFTTDHDMLRIFRNFWTFNHWKAIECSNLLWVNKNLLLKLQWLRTYTITYTISYITTYSTLMIESHFVVELQNSNNNKHIHDQILYIDKEPDLCTGTITIWWGALCHHEQEGLGHGVTISRSSDCWLAITIYMNKIKIIVDVKA